MNDTPLFDIPQEPEGTAAAPLCPLCRLRPVKWGPRTGDWARYCGGSACTNTHRKCLGCTNTFPMGEFRFVKYCSTECRDAVAQSRRGRWHQCIRCGTTSETRKAQPHGWRDGRCSDCWRTRIGGDRMKALILHNVSFEDADQWAAEGWRCHVCLTPVPTARGAIDHDHSCCPGSRSCGKCVRGFLHNECNLAIGLLHDDPATLRAAADYLDAYNQRR